LRYSNATLWAPGLKGFFEKNFTIDVTDMSDSKAPGFFSKLKSGLAKTRAQLADGVGNLLLGEKEINDTVLEDLETALITTDVGVDTTQDIIENLTQRAQRRELANTRALHEALHGQLVERLLPIIKPFELPEKRSGMPRIIFFVGVNGVGKTTTIGKLAKRFKDDGKSVLLAAGDTFRAAAVEQLQAWGERNDIPVIAQPQGSDSASVVFDAVQSAQARDVDVLLVDTAGRLQAKTQLMDELEKVQRVVKRLDPDAPHEVILVLDGGVGQNALSQVKLFDEAVKLTGLVVTKLDGTAKAGVVFAVASGAGGVPKIPLYFIGVGEGVDDLRPFDADDFVQALLASDQEDD
jgi:fused signal recognition particle receptor